MRSEVLPSAPVTTPGVGVLGDPTGETGDRGPGHGSHLTAGYSWFLDGGGSGSIFGDGPDVNPLPLLLLKLTYTGPLAQTSTTL